jgi:hypothetical protein
VPLVIGTGIGSIFYGDPDLCDQGTITSGRSRA